MNIIYLLIISLLAGIITFFLPKGSSKIPNVLLIITSAIGIGLSYLVCIQVLNNSPELHQSFAWLPEMGARFSISISGVSAMLCLLTSICFLLIGLATHHKPIAQGNTFYGLMLLSMTGLLGVFIAQDAFLFYMFWELALIPVYFLCSMWGGENRIKVSFKFFIYTFVGSLIMLVALIYMYNKTPDHSFAWDSFMQLTTVLTNAEQFGLFWMMFLAFAIKMPIFPFHTWQPATYSQSFTPVTMVLSAIMVKMGLYAVLHWLLPIFPDAAHYFSTFITILCVISIIYASLVALKQSDIKKLAAYSSIAHIGLMCAALFTYNEIGIIGASLQMFSHGINIIGMWLLVYFLENKFGTQDMNQMGGMASKNPTFAIFLVVITLANVALPLTNGFPGEFMMFNGIFNSKHLSSNTYNIVLTALAGLGIILGAVYSLNMVQKVALGEWKRSDKENESMAFDTGEWLALVIVTLLIVIFGFFPQPIIDLIKL